MYFCGPFRPGGQADPPQLWCGGRFKLSLVRDADGAGASLAELQGYLAQFPPSYYTKNGKEPLVYPYVLAASLQVTRARSALRQYSMSLQQRPAFMRAAVKLGATMGTLQSHRWPSRLKLFPSGGGALVEARSSYHVPLSARRKLFPPLLHGGPLLNT